MVCYHPVQGWRAPNGQITSSKRRGWSDKPVTRACGGCIGCRLEISRQWAVRIMHESSLYQDNAFLTLTYRDEALHESDSLCLDDWQRFMKRLKERLQGRRIRFFQCGEYGETTFRPHYHAILFDIDFVDKVFLKQTENGDQLFTSEFLDDVWGLGDCYIGDVTFQSAAYCGRYVMKKLTGARKSEYGSREPERHTSSRRPGLGKPWLDKWKTDVFPNDFCVLEGKQVKVPSYYDDMVSAEEVQTGSWKEDSTGFKYFMPDLKLTASEKRKGDRARSAKKHSADNTPDRLAVREEVQRARLSKLVRS